MAPFRIERLGNGESTTQAVRVEGGGMVELYACARPSRDEGGFREQAGSMYANLHRLLTAQGAGLRDVITEKVFLNDLDRQVHDLRGVRPKREDGTPHAAEYAPAALFLQQPPCSPGRLCELQAYAAIPATGSASRIRGRAGLPGLASGRILEHENCRRLYLMNLTGEGDGFAARAEGMFARAEACLRREGYAFRDIVRTWFYIADMDRDYAAFNRTRTRLYEALGVSRLPASTAIQGRTDPGERGCAMDLLAVAGDPSVDARVIHAPTMNEAPAYGSSFSRGIRLKLSTRNVIHISGTASIDTEGRVVHVGDVEGQIHRMLENLERLLAVQGAGVKDIASAITYLKKPGYLETFRRVCRERSIPTDMPNTVSVADICRPDWLCEIEALAIRPANG